MKDLGKIPGWEINYNTPEVHGSKMQTSLRASAWIALLKQVLAQQQSPWRASRVSRCQSPGRRAARLLPGLTRAGASPGIPQCLLPAPAAVEPGTRASRGKIASHLA